MCEKASPHWCVVLLCLFGITRLPVQQHKYMYVVQISARPQTYAVMLRYTRMLNRVNQSACRGECDNVHMCGDVLLWQSLETSTRVTRSPIVLFLHLARYVNAVCTQIKQGIDDIVSFTYIGYRALYRVSDIAAQVTRVLADQLNCNDTLRQVEKLLNLTTRPECKRVEWLLAHLTWTDPCIWVSGQTV